MTPAEKLARSRLAIVDYLEGRSPRREKHRDHPTEQQLAGEPSVEEMAKEELRDRPRRSGWLGGMSSAARAWWSHHPAQLALEMATPSLQSYMRRRPFQVLALSAGVGVLLVVTRPWRLISVTTLVVAIVKSSQLSGVVMSAVADAQGWQRQQQGREPHL